MVDATTRFFEDLDRRGYEPLLAKTSGTLRIDLHEGAQTRHWLLRIDHGRLNVESGGPGGRHGDRREPGPLRRHRLGREHGLAALLRGDMTVTGDARLVVQVERIFPGSPDARGPRRRFAGEVH